MARFYSEIQGNRGEATRMGTADSGIRGHIRGWRTGIRVCGGTDKDGEDVFYVYATGGSTGRTPDVLIATVKEGEVKCCSTDP